MSVELRERLKTAYGIEFVRYAGFWIRAVAVLIDLFIMLVVTAGLALLVQLSGLSALVAAGSAWSSEYLLFGLPGLLHGSYYVIMTSCWGGTLGKIFTGCRVINAVSGKHLDWPDSFLRYFTSLISWLFLGLGCLIVAGTPRKQAMHDYAVGSLVILR